MRLLLAALLLAGLALVFAPEAAPAQGKPEIVSGTAEVTEGDLLSVGGQELRLHGIDAPDQGQTCKGGTGADYDCFDKARQALDILTRGKTLECEIRATLPGQPKVGVCRAEGRDVAATMVAGGWAFAWRRLSDDYVTFERLAQSRRSGFWAGQAEAPWHWRDRQRAKAPRP
ncbi:MAG TPA: thermonuclease family protein [Azospirillaceae bacterium]|nr:thermonuclease family protein [Azospirillaceae bacterium]